jgi:hypothetical protein
MGNYIPVGIEVNIMVFYIHKLYSTILYIHLYVCLYIINFMLSVIKEIILIIEIIQG